VDEVLSGEDAAWHVRLLEQSMVVPGPVTEQLGEAARQAGVYVVMGVDEREEHGGTVYNTLLYLGPDGRLLGNHRKLMPTHFRSGRERLRSRDQGRIDRLGTAGRPR
jgi:predicted amidohydrolase